MAATDAAAPLCARWRGGGRAPAQRLESHRVSRASGSAPFR